jgi:hypothetical protein
VVSVVGEQHGRLDGVCSVRLGRSLAAGALDLVRIGLERVGVEQLAEFWKVTQVTQVTQVTSRRITEVLELVLTDCRMDFVIDELRNKNKTNQNKSEPYKRT